MHMSMSADAPRDTGKEGLLGGVGDSHVSTKAFIVKHAMHLAFGAMFIIIVTLAIALSAENAKDRNQRRGNGNQYINNKAAYGDTVVLEMQGKILCQIAYYNYVANIMGWQCYNGVPLNDNYCSWKGVVCDDDGYMLSLTLSPYDTGFAQQIPTTLGYLSALTSLSLSSYPYYGKLYGVIPTTLGYLTNLRALYISRNAITGTLPTEIGYLTNLEVLALHRNKISGQIPSEIGLLTALTALSISNNDFTGKLPDSVGNMVNMVTFQIWNNLMSGTITSGYGKMSKLEDLYISNNQFTGTVPSALCLPSLTSLQFNNKGLTCYANCLLTIMQKSQVQQGQQQGNVPPCSDPGTDYFGQGNNK